MLLSLVYFVIRHFGCAREPRQVVMSSKNQQAACVLGEPPLEIVARLARVHAVVADLA